MAVNACQVDADGLTDDETASAFLRTINQCSTQSGMCTSYKRGTDLIAGAFSFGARESLPSHPVCAENLVRVDEGFS